MKLSGPNHPPLHVLQERATAELLRNESISSYVMVGDIELRENPLARLENMIDQVLRTIADICGRAGLWTKVEGGWQFENWAKWQKTKAQVLTVDDGGDL